jgi:hypothetical protein
VSTPTIFRSYLITWPFGHNITNGASVSIGNMYLYGVIKKMTFYVTHTVTGGGTLRIALYNEGPYLDYFTVLDSTPATSLIAGTNLTPFTTISYVGEEGSTIQAYADSGSVNIGLKIGILAAVNPASPSYQQGLPFFENTV